MSCAGLFLLLVVFSVSQTSTLDCSDQQSTGSASGMADHQQVTTLQYCLVDNWYHHEGGQWRDTTLLIVYW